MALLEVKNLGISFGGLRAVDNFSLKIEKGQLYGLIGPTFTLSKTDIFPKSLIFWKVLAIPFLFISIADLPASSSPSNIKEPSVGL